MYSPVRSIFRQFTRKTNDKLNILFYKDNERYASLLARTEHNFFDLSGINWNHLYAAEPANFTPILNQNQLSEYADYDLVLCLGRNKNYEKCITVANTLHIPLVLFEEDYPNTLDKNIISRKGHENVFISKHQASAWNFNHDYTIIDNPVDSDVFFRDESIEKEDRILCCVNNWIEKDFSHGASLANSILSKLPYRRTIYGNNTSFVHYRILAEEMNKCAIYLNTTQKVSSPVGMLEAASCGAVVVAYNNTNISEVLPTAYLLDNDTPPEKAAEKIEILIRSNKLTEISKNTIDFMKTRKKTFIEDVNKVFYKAAKHPFKGII